MSEQATRQAVPPVTPTPRPVTADQERPMTQQQADPAGDGVMPKIPEGDWYDSGEPGGQMWLIRPDGQTAFLRYDGKLLPGSFYPPNTIRAACRCLTDDEAHLRYASLTTNRPETPVGLHAHCCKLCGAPFTNINGMSSTTCDCARLRPVELIAAQGTGNTSLTTLRKLRDVLQTIDSVLNSFDGTDFVDLETFLTQARAMLADAITETEGDMVYQPNKKRSTQDESSTRE